MRYEKKKSGRLAALMLAALLLVQAQPCARADTDRLPDVSAGMTEAAYWAEKTDEPGAVLADGAQIKALNSAILATEECMMLDMGAEIPPWDGTVLQRTLLANAMQCLADFLSEGYFNAGGERVPYRDMAAVLEAIDGGESSAGQEPRYGICVRLADVRAVPTAALITDAAGDNDFDMLQISSVRVNEPVVIRAETADGSWFYCDTACVSGWIPAEDIAVCADRGEWLAAWSIPEDELLVVTEGKLYLDESNVNAGASQRMLTMGTALRRVKEEDFDPAVTNRAPYQNYAVYLPVRGEDGAYGTTIALIPVHCSVSEGWLPLTVENVLETAFSMLGDAYGWGGMLSVPDCSQYVRNVYRCFGLELPRNTTWQSAMPARSYDLAGLDTAQKSALLDTLPPGAILFFSGHEMLYLGQEEGLHYVLSSVSSMMSPEDGSRLRVRSVVINTLEGTKRANGKTWMEALDQATLPFGPADAGETDGTEMRQYEADKTAEVNGVTLHYAAVGEGRPVILLHGNGEDHDLFDTQIAQLVKAGYRVYAPDTRGHGANEPLEEYHYADMAEDIYQFIMALGLEEKPALYGHSDGGITALLLELNHPGTLGAMAISGTNLSPAGLDPAFVEAYEKQNAEHPDPLVTLMLTEPHIDAEKLAGINIPVLVTAGERDLILREETERLAAALPNATLIIVPDADHGSYIVNDPRMGALLIPFLAQNWCTSPLIPLPAESPSP